MQRSFIYELSGNIETIYVFTEVDKVSRRLDSAIDRICNLMRSTYPSRRSEGFWYVTPVGRILKIQPQCKVS
jgi:hypothetical protein